MTLNTIPLLVIPLAISLATIRLTFLSWYEREIKYKSSLIISLIVSLIICAVLWYVSPMMSEDLLMMYQVISVTTFFLMIPQLYLLVTWTRKGAQKAFICLSVSAYIMVLWLLFPLAYMLIPKLTPQQKLIASYISGITVGTLLPMGVIEEVEVKDGVVPATTATLALTIADGVTSHIFNFTIYMYPTLQWAMMGVFLIITPIVIRKIVTR